MLRMGMAAGLSLVALFCSCSACHAPVTVGHNFEVQHRPVEEIARQLRGEFGNESPNVLFDEEVDSKSVFVATEDGSALSPEIIKRIETRVRELDRE